MIVFAALSAIRWELSCKVAAQNTVSSNIAVPYNDITDLQNEEGFRHKTTLRAVPICPVLALGLHCSRGAHQLPALLQGGCGACACADADPSPAGKGDLAIARA